jgi:putative ABC transport system ATP-binding protein
MTADVRRGGDHDDPVKESPVFHRTRPARAATDDATSDSSTGGTGNTDDTGSEDTGSAHGTGTTGSGGPGTTASARGATVVVAGLTKTFPSGDSGRITAVHQADLTIPSGGTVALTGPSGSGKSTLLHLIGAIDVPDSGTITVAGTEITSAGRGALSRYRRTIGFVFQRFHLLPALTARDNVIAPLLPYRKRADGLARATELLAAVGLAGREDALPSQLSGGQQQRVAIARALIGEPGLLLADEPTGNLDSDTGTGIIELLLKLNADFGTTMLIATHDPAIAARCTYTVPVLDGHVTGGALSGGTEPGEGEPREADPGPGATRRPRETS